MNRITLFLIAIFSFSKFIIKSFIKLILFISFSKNLNINKFNYLSYVKSFNVYFKSFSDLIELFDSIFVVSLLKEPNLLFIILFSLNKVSFSVSELKV